MASKRSYLIEFALYKDTLMEKFIHPPFKIGWHNFAFSLPPEWEVTSYVLRQEDGTMGFADESGALGQMTWRTVKAVPDKEKIMSEIHRRYLKDEDSKNHATFKDLKFTPANMVILGYDQPGTRFYASAFLEKTKLLVEWVFPDYSEEKSQTVLPMLKSFKQNDPVDGKIFYGGFGLEVNLPENFKLETVSALPAAITMEFENKKHHRITAHRWGMPQLLFEGSDVKDFYHRFLYNQCRYVIKNIHSSEFFGKEGTEVDFRVRGRFGLDMLLGPWWRGKATAYHDKNEMRVYAIEHAAPNRIKDRLTANDVFSVNL